MANKRMFSPDIVGSDAFIEMAPSTQALYFHLGMRADDDGFVNPKIIMRMIGSQEDELKILVAKKFVLPFENGVIVIKHWRINNFVRKDRYKETLYTREKNLLLVRENQAYTFNNDGRALPINQVPWKSDSEIRVLHIGQPTVNQRSTQDRIGKDRLGKDSKEIQPHTHISYLENIPEKDIEEFSEKLRINKSDILSKAEDLLNYCKSKGKTYKDYKAFLSNALKSDYKKNTVTVKTY